MSAAARSRKSLTASSNSRRSRAVPFSRTRFNLSSDSSRYQATPATPSRACARLPATQSSISRRRSISSKAASASWPNAASTPARRGSPPRSGVDLITTPASSSNCMARAMASSRWWRGAAGGGRTLGRVDDSAWLPRSDPRGRLFDLGRNLDAIRRPTRFQRGRVMTSPFVLAVPSKGRLQENAEAFFTRAGLALAKPRGARDYRGTISGLDNVEIAYLSASEIAAQLSRGAVHLGVTGEDLVRESIVDADKRVALIEALGFGSANVVVAVPQAWIDVRTMADLDDVTTGFRARHNRRMRIATKYINLTRTFFASHGVVDYRIVESAGATEGAPAVGTAEMIVDITTTGATLAANGLKVLDDGVILRSHANLVASKDADWSGEARETARVILDHIAARARASKYREIRTRFTGGDAALRAEAHNSFGVR